MNRAAEFSVRQTVLVNVLFFVCVVGGFSALNLTEVEYFHDVTLNEVNITTVWPGASADEVERLVTSKIEEELASVTEIAEIRSASQANSSTIAVEYEETLNDAELESAINDTRGALDRVADLPAGAEEPALFAAKTGNFSPIVLLAVSDEAGVGELAIRDVALEAASRLRELPGVNVVTVRGLQDREVRVLVNGERAAAYGLTIADIAGRVRRQNQNLPAGTFETAAGESTLRATGDYRSLEEIRETVVREDEAGARVLLRDVARVERGLEKRQTLSRYNGKPAAVISVTKKDAADVRETVARVDEWAAQFRALMPEGVKLQKTLDAAEFVSPRINTLLANLLTGALLVFAVLWFTIGFRNSMLTIIAIPFAFLSAIMFFPLFDISINANTLIGMLLVSGMLVDDAIIVLENIYRRIEQGDPLRKAVVEGAGEVMWPVVAAVATSIAAFAPLLLVEGTAGKFISVLPKAVVVCLLASLFECLIILPAHYLDFGSRGKGGGGFLQRMQATADAGLAFLRRHYLRALDYITAYKGAFALLTAALLMAAMAFATRLSLDLFPGEYSDFTVNLEAPSHFNLERTTELVREIEQRIAGMPDAEELIGDYNTTIGFAIDLNYDPVIAPNLGVIYVEIKESEANRLNPERVLSAVRVQLQQIKNERPQDIVELRAEARRYGPPIGRPVEVRIESENFALNESIAEEIKAYLRTLPGVSGVDDNLKSGLREIRLRLDAPRAAAVGLTFQDVARALRAANDGMVASSFRPAAAIEDDDIRVMLQPKQRNQLGDLLEIDIRTPDGRLIKLGDVAQLDFARGTLSYRRMDGKRAVTVFAAVDDNLATSQSANRELRAQFAGLEARYPEAKIVYGGEFQDSNEAMANTFAIFPVALLAIYMILAALFRSYWQPLIVLTSVPVGFAGLILGVGALGYDVSFNLLYASVGLAGVVVNDALVMVDFINRARRGGMPLAEALRQAGAQRLRPVLLTTLTTVAALMPMALGLVGASKTYGPFTASIAFGLLGAMFGTLFVVPLSYSVLFRLGELSQYRWARLWGVALPLLQQLNPWHK